jgi:nucleoside-diphosphate-sugar epimerase
MNILVTGNQGYIGSVLTVMLAEQGYRVIGLDTGYFSECLLEQFDPRIQLQIRKDVRDAVPDDFQGVDAVIHLAGLSNDPLGELAPNLTEEINFSGTMNIAECARKAGVSRFVYASSQSMYGVADTTKEVEEDSSPKNPVTAYARTKWDAEVALRGIHSDKFSVSCFRPSTVFGASPRLRCDIVFNNLVACAYTTGKIDILSDGSPWRPVVHVQDVCKAFISGFEAPIELVGGESFNVGIKDGNFTVRDLAVAAQKSVPGSELRFLGEHGSDSRTYKVSFQKILTQLKDWYKPTWDLDSGGQELVQLFDRIQFIESQFRGVDCIRLKKLELLQANNIVDAKLRKTNI